jgi:hypothetical protein
MFSLRNRFGIPGVIAVIALVFAMFGGAYAASGGQGGKATSSAKAKKGPRGPKGATGPAGPAGPAGPTGPAGAKGDAGAAGSNGAPGADGKSPEGTSFTGSKTVGSTTCTEGGIEYKGANTTLVCNGKKGANGTTGFTTTLPEGKTETGSWSFGYTVKNTLVPISFPIPLAGPLDGDHVHYINAAGKEVVFFLNDEFEEELEEKTPTACLGSAAEPSAAPGNLCVYAASTSTGAPLLASQFILSASGASVDPFTEAGAAKSGSRLYVAVTSEVAGWGTWAVTAE